MRTYSPSGLCSDTKAATGRSDEVTARHVLITGRVQGVFFRAWAVEQANALGVTGWVRNCPDRRVETHVEGEQAAVEQMIERLQRGPPAARVEDVRLWTSNRASSRALSCGTSAPAKAGAQTRAEA
jgi:acylphosphatase